MNSDRFRLLDFFVILTMGLTIHINNALAETKAAPSLPPSLSPSLDTNLITELTKGSEGIWDNEESVFKVTLPNPIPMVTMAGLPLIPEMGLASWAAFKSTGEATQVIGELHLLEVQLNPVMSALLRNHFQVTAIYNRYFWDNPRTFFLQFEGKGELKELAASLGQVVYLINQTASLPYPQINNLDPRATTFSSDKLEAFLGKKLNKAGEVYKIVMAKATQINGITIARMMGAKTEITFAGSNKLMTMNGSFAVLEPELQPLLKALSDAKINVVSIHNSIPSEPRLIFVDIWAIDKMETLGQALRTVFDELKI